MIRNFFVSMYKASLESWAGKMWAAKLNGKKTRQTDVQILCVYIYIHSNCVVIILHRLLRETVLSIACQMNDTETLFQASDIFEKWIKGEIRYSQWYKNVIKSSSCKISKVNQRFCHCECSSVPVNLRLLVYRYGMKNSGKEQSWEIMFQRYLSTTLAQEKDKLLYGLASIENVSLLNR